MISLSSNSIIKTSFCFALILIMTGCHARRHSRYTTQVRRTPTQYRCVPQQPSARVIEHEAPLPKPELLIKPESVTPRMQVPKKEMNSVPPKIEPIPVPLKNNASPVKKKPIIMTPNESYNNDTAPSAKPLQPKKQATAPPQKKNVTPAQKPKIVPKRQKRKIEEDEDLFIRQDLPPAPPIEKTPQVNRPSFKDLVAMSISHSAARSRERDLVFSKRKQNQKRVSNSSSLSKLPIITPRSENRIDFYRSIPSRDSIPLPKSKTNRPLITLEAPIFLDNTTSKKPIKTAPPITRIDLTIPQHQFPVQTKKTDAISVSHPSTDDNFRLNLPSWNQTPTTITPAKIISHSSNNRPMLKVLLPSRNSKSTSTKPEPRKLWFR